MDIKHLYSTRFLPTSLVVSLLVALGGCASTPDAEPEYKESEKVKMVIRPTPEPEVVELKPNYPEKYVVVKGDTLWDISSRFLKDPWKWPRLWHFNPHIANPHLIYPGDILSIVFINGKPMLQVERNGRMINVPVDIPPEALQGKSYPTVKLRPRVREGGLEEAIPTIPIDVIGPFLKRPRVVGENELDAAPYILANTETRLMAGGGYKVYARGLNEEGLQGDYVVVRAGEVYRNPDDEDDILGREAVFLGEARLMAFGDPSTLQVTTSNREIMRGDRLVPKGDELILHSFTPRAPEQKVEGQIISVMDGVNRVGLYRVVVLDLGRQDDMIPGHVLAINQKGIMVKDIVDPDSDEVELPTERAGTVMIFRVFDRVSYGLITEAVKPIYLHDQVVTP